MSKRSVKYPLIARRHGTMRKLSIAMLVVSAAFAAVAIPPAKSAAANIECLIKVVRQVFMFV